MTNYIISQSLSNCITSVFFLWVGKKAFQKILGCDLQLLKRRTYGKTYSTTPKRYAQTLAENGEVSGLKPKPQNRPIASNPWTEKCTPTCAILEQRQRDEASGRSGGGELHRPRVSHPCSWNCLPSHPIPQPTTTWKGHWVGFPYGEETRGCVCVCLDGLAGYGGSLWPIPPSL